MSIESQSSHDSPSELREFYTFAVARLADDEHGLSPEDIVEQWRERHPVPEDRTATVAALRAALADMDAGDTGTPREEYDRKTRARHGLPPRS